MKKIIAILVIAILVCICTGCTEVEGEQTGEKSMFVELERTLQWRVVYHKDTKVMYAVSWGRYNVGNFTLLVDADGKPLLWKGGVQE